LTAADWSVASDPAEQLEEWAGKRPPPTLWPDSWDLRRRLHRRLKGCCQDGLTLFPSVLVSHNVSLYTASLFSFFFTGAIYFVIVLILYTSLIFN
jgi:hypothetical protein